MAGVPPPRVAHPHSVLLCVYSYQCGQMSESPASAPSSGHRVKEAHSPVFRDLREPAPPRRRLLIQPDPGTPAWESGEAALCWLLTGFQCALVRGARAQGFLGAPDCQAGPRFPGVVGKSGYCIQRCLRAGLSSLLWRDGGLAFSLLPAITGPGPRAVSEDILVSATQVDGTG